MIEDIIDIPATPQKADEQIEKDVRALDVLAEIAKSTGDISNMFSRDELVKLGSDAVTDYEQDLADRDDWERVVKDALKKASQEDKREIKTYPWNRASDVHYPLLTVAALQFNARAYPAVVKGDEAVSCKVIGADRGLPKMGLSGQPLMSFQGLPVEQTPEGAVVMTPQGPQPLPQGAQPEPVWEREPGAKANRAGRVKTYLNTTIFYRMEDWEADTDMLLMQLPIVGCAFRKVWRNQVRKKHCAALVHALNLVAPMGAKSCKTAPRLTEKLPDQYPVDILAKMRTGYYRIADFLGGEEFDQSPRLLLEQHRLIDLDGDNFPEPYIVTVDHQSQEVLRVVANFGPENIKVDGERVIEIEGTSFYIKYDFFPHPEGKFYGIGLGHLLNVIGGVIDTAINQMMDAGTAQTAGGGWIGSGVRLQGSRRSSRITFEPGEYKTVDVPGNALREAIVERTYPAVSPVMFQLLELMLGAANDISSTKDVITGDASNNGQVGTTLALIEQGLQVYSALIKRIFRSLKEEYQLLFDNVGKYADEETAADYREILDDPQADFKADFSAADMDIRPVSDPTTATKMQAVARANYLLQFAGQPGINTPNIFRRAMQAADIEDIDELLVPQNGPSPAEQAQLALTASEVKENDANAEKLLAEAEAKKGEALAAKFSEGMKMGMAA